MNGKTKNTPNNKGIGINTLSAGIIGAGLMGYWHAWTVKNIGGNVAAIFDSDTKASEELSKRFSDSKRFTDVGAMLKYPELDVLHICTPPSTHFEIAKLGIKAGLNLIIDKPITKRFCDTISLLNKASELGLYICPVHQFAFQDGVIKTKQQLSRIGRLIHIESILCSAGAKGLPEDVSDEILEDTLSHPLSLIHMFLPNGLSNQQWIVSRPSIGEFRAYSETCDISISIFISMNARPTQCSLKLMGTDGTIHTDLFHGFSFFEPGTVSRKKKIMHPFDLSVRRFYAASSNLVRRIFYWEPAYPGLKLLISQFYKSLGDGSRPPISNEDIIAIEQTRENLINITPKKNDLSQNTIANG